MLPFVVFVILFFFGRVSSIESEDILTIYGHYKTWKKDREEYVNLLRGYPVGYQGYNCPFLVERDKALDVHTLAPWNVNVLASLGDSLSAGRATGAEHLEDLLKDYPGLSFVTGGDKPLEKEVTLYNMFKQYNPHLTRSRVFNVAKSGSLSYDLYEQVIKLEKQLKASKAIDLENDWKFINIFIGSNDLCKMCRNETLLNSDTYYDRLIEVIQYIKSNIPRSFVNLMPPLSVQLLRDTHSNPFCVDFHSVTCSCILSMNMTEFSDTKRNFDKMMDKVVDSIKETDNFAVVAAPAIAAINHLPKIGSLPNIAFPTLDCFHFSVMAVDVVAKMVWNGLFQSVEKKEKIKSFDDFNPKNWECPSPNCPFLRTARNSANCSTIIGKIRYPSLPQRDEVV